jgi:hypothetical protein
MPPPPPLPVPLPTPHDGKLISGKKSINLAGNFEFRVKVSSGSANPTKIKVLSKNSLPCLTSACAAAGRETVKVTVELPESVSGTFGFDTEHETLLEGGWQKMLMVFA